MSKKIIIVFLVFQSVLFANFPALAKESVTHSEEEIQNIISQYRTALSKKNLKEMEKTVWPELMVVEGVHVNDSWADYRDHHIGPEMNDWQSFETLKPAKILKTITSPDQTVVSSEIIYRIKTKKETTDLKALETYVLRKDNGTWKIALIHFSGKPVKSK